MNAAAPAADLAAAAVASGWPAPRDRPYVKVCGVTTPRLAEAAVDAGVDMVGILHFPPSPRHLDVAAAADVASAARGRALTVALTVDADDATLDALVATVRPDAIQLHGRETPERVAAIAARYGIAVAKALGIATAADLAPAGTYEALLVLDAKPPADADRPGGHGRRFDWALLAGLRAPFMLSGGLDAAAVGDAVRRLAPYAVDVSSGVESDGVKDPAKIAAFVAAVRSA